MGKKNPATAGLESGRGRMDQMYGTKGSSDSDTAIWDDAARQTEPSGKALGRILAAVFHRICLHIGQLLHHK